MSGNRSLDYATRTLIAETIRHTLAQELPDAAMMLQQREERPIVLHGPCSHAAESLVLGTVLTGELPASAVPLDPADFWSTLHARLWTALQHAETLQGPGPEHWRPLHTLEVLGLVSGPLTPFSLTLDELTSHCTALAGLRDVASAILLIQQHSKSRRLARLLQSLTYDLTHGEADHESAYEALRAHFAHERPKPPSTSR